MSCDTDLLQFFNQRLTIILPDTTFYFFKFSMSFNNRGAKRKERFLALFHFSHKTIIVLASRDVSSTLKEDFTCICTKVAELLLSPAGFCLFFFSFKKKGTNTRPSTKELLSMSLILNNYIHINQNVTSNESNQV